jgi:hypothetical protein
MLGEKQAIAEWISGQVVLTTRLELTRAGMTAGV